MEFSRLHSPGRYVFYSTQKYSKGTAQIDRNGNGGIAASIRSRGGGSQRHKFVALDFCGDACLAVIRCFDAHHAAMTTDIHVARGDHLLWQGDDKIDFISVFKFIFCKEVQSSVTHI